MTFKEWLKKTGRWQEMAGTGPYIGGCASTPDYNVWGACSDQKPQKKHKKKKGKK